jgi:hypothetical protein
VVIEVIIPYNIQYKVCRERENIKKDVVVVKVRTLESIIVVPMNTFLNW